MPLRRRGLLVVLTTGAVVGCQEVPVGEESPPADTATGDSPSPTPKSAAAVGCPSYDRYEPTRVVCSVDPPEESLVFEPASETVTGPTATVDCRLENTTDEPFETNYYDWRLHRYADDAWHHLGPYAVPMPLHRLPPGETHVRRLYVDNTDLKRVQLPSPPTASGTDERGTRWTAGRHGLGPGTYAVAIESDSERDGTVYSAAFTLRGDPVPLVAPETVTEATRDGGHVTVDVDPLYEETGGHVLTVRKRADVARETHALVDEQLYHPTFAGLRAALTHVADGVDIVSVRGDDSQHTRNLASGMGFRFVAYDGDVYELQLGMPARTDGSREYDLSGGWRSFAADARNTGHLETAVPSAPVEAWRFETAGRVYDGPAVAGDLVFVPSTDGNVYAVTAADGEKVWQFPVQGQVRVTPAVVDDTVYAAGQAGGLYAIDAATGDQRWVYDGSPAGYAISHPTVLDGTVYVGDNAGTLFAVDAETGAERWQVETGGDIASSPAVADGTVYVGWRGRATPGNTGGGLDAVSTDGTRQWRVQPGKVDGSPTVVDGSVLAGTDEGLFAVDDATGEIEWTFDRGSAASPAVVDDTAFVGTHTGNLHAVDVTTGEQRWVFGTDKWAHTAPAVGDGVVVLSSWDDNVYGVDATDGSEQWAVELTTPISDVAIADGSVYVGSDRSLVALRTP